ncbi:DUF3519 domain-containing protein [Helicobacter sp. 13S00477-4]|uniref:putative barnase/colicin E5 family endoribonuclease n=1 Tax=Helicobacter sp. 13S00477-4 TaxID=1905759 RepID=UPI000BA75584|nr:DUF3519 domain-containing protein [Helicobacter sp. 13S00477-4]PAF51987.1 hypothetical protein BKH44_04825 [Helicobacter sp. 13S00477-4]
MRFDFESAKKAGASDEQILNFLQSTPYNDSISTLKNAGLEPSNILNILSNISNIPDKSPTQPTQQPNPIPNPNNDNNTNGSNEVGFIPKAIYDVSGLDFSKDHTLSKEHKENIKNIFSQNIPFDKLDSSQLQAIDKEYDNLNDAYKYKDKFGRPDFLTQSAQKYQQIKKARENQAQVRELIDSNLDYDELNDAQKEAINKELSFKDKLINSFHRDSSNWKRFKEEYSANLIEPEVYERLSQLNNVSKEKSISNLFTQDPQAKQQYMQDVYKLATSAGFDDVLFDKDKMFFQKNDQIYRVKDGFLDTILDDIKSMKYEIGNSIAGAFSGGIAGAKYGKNWQSKVAGGLVGSALGAYSGAGLDYALNNWALDRKADNKELLNKMGEAGALDLIGNTALLGSGKLLAKSYKSLINTPSFIKKSLKYAKQQAINVNVNAIPKVMESVGIPYQKAKDISKQFEKYYETRYSVNDPDTLIGKILDSIPTDKDVLEKEKIAFDVAYQNPVLFKHIAHVAQKNPQFSHTLYTIITDRANKIAKNPDIELGDIQSAIKGYESDLKQEYGQSIDLFKQVLPKYRFYPQDFIDNKLESLQRHLGESKSEGIITGIRNQLEDIGDRGIDVEDMIDLRKTINKNLRTHKYSYNDKGTLKDINSYIDNEIYTALEKNLPDNEALGNKLKTQWQDVNAKYAELSSLQDTKLYKDIFSKNYNSDNKLSASFSKWLGTKDKLSDTIIGKLDSRMQDLTQSYIISKEIEKHIQRTNTAGKYVDWLSLRDSLDKLETKITNESLKDYISELRGMSQLFYNDAQIMKMIQNGDIAVSIGANGLSTNYITKFHTSFVNSTFKKLLAYLPTQTGRNLAFRYHIQQSLKHSRTSKDFIFDLISSEATPPALIKELKNEVLHYTGTLGKVLDSAAEQIQRNDEKSFLNMIEASKNYELGIHKNQDFGTNYPQFYHLGKQAIEHLLTTKEGQVQGAFYKEGLGDIDLVYGDDKFGLKHIFDKHPEVVDKIPEIIENGEVITSDSGIQTIKLKDFKVGLSNGWHNKGNNNWIITAYEDLRDKGKTFDSTLSSPEEALPEISSRLSHSDIRPSNELASRDGNDLPSNNLQPNPTTTELKNQDFGTNYAEFYHLGKQAIEHLLTTKEGQVQGAFYKEGLGDIDLVYGDDKFGLKHIFDKHPEVVDKIPEIIEKGNIVKQNDLRYRIELDNKVVGLVGEYKGNKKDWILTAFEKEATPQIFSDEGLKSESHNLSNKLQYKDHSLPAYPHQKQFKPEPSAHRIQDDPKPNPTTTELKNQEPIKGRDIKKRKLTLENPKRKIDIVYKVIEAKDLKPNFIGGSGMQYRYADNQNAITKIVDDFDADIHFGKEGGFDGVPIVDYRGNILAGNHRSQAILNLYKHNKQKPYIEGIEEYYDKDILKGFKQPLIVRVLESKDDELINYLAKISNKDRENSLSDRLVTYAAMIKPHLKSLEIHGNLENNQDIVNILKLQGLDSKDAGRGIIGILNENIPKAVDSYLRRATKAQAGELLNILIDNAYYLFNIRQLSKQSPKFKPFDLTHLLDTAIRTIPTNTSTSPTQLMEEVIDKYYSRFIEMVDAHKYADLVGDPKEFKSDVLGVFLASLIGRKDKGVEAFRTRYEQALESAKEILNGDFYHPPRDIDEWDMIRGLLNGKGEILDNDTIDSRLLKNDYKEKFFELIQKAQDWDNLTKAYEKESSISSESFTKGDSLSKNSNKLNSNPTTTQFKNQDFGTNYPQFYHLGKQAIEHLLTTKEGQVQGAFYRPEIGDITLVWGKEGSGKSDGFGLAKIAKYHPEVLDKLDDLVQTLPIKTQTEGRYQLENEHYKIGIRKDYEGNVENWILTAFQKDTSTVSRRTDLKNTPDKAVSKTTLTSVEYSKKSNKFSSSNDFTESEGLLSNSQPNPTTTQFKNQDFGTNYAEFYHKGKEAIEHLLTTKEGQVQGAFYKEGLGDIDLVYGKVWKNNKDEIEGFGLAKIIKKHPEITPQILADIVNNGKINKAENQAITITKDNFKVALKSNWQGKPTKNHWVITAYEDTRANSKIIDSTISSPDETLSEISSRLSHSDSQPSNELALKDGTNLPSNNLNSNPTTTELKNQESKKIQSNPYLGAGIVGGLGGLETSNDDNEGDELNMLIGSLSAIVGIKGIKYLLNRNPNLLKNVLIHHFPDKKQAIDKAFKKEIRGIYNVAYHDKKATMIKKDLENIDNAIRLTKGYHREKTNRGKGTEHIIIKHQANTNRRGYITQDELLNLGNSIRQYLKNHQEPFIDKNGSRIYEWENNEGIRFRVITHIPKGRQTSVVHYSTFGNEDIITFYSDRNLKHKMQFKNDKLQKSLSKAG